MTENERAVFDTGRHLHPVWQPTDWTPRQRTQVVGSLFMLASAYLILGVALALGGKGTVIRSILLPVGLTYVCLCAGRLASVYWYPYKHGLNRVDEPSEGGSALYIASYLVEALALLSLALQLLGGLLQAFGQWTPEATFNYDMATFLAPMLLCLLLSLLLAIAASATSWRPERDSLAADGAIGARVVGWRLTLRWAVMLLARNVWLLIGAPWFAYLDLSGDPTTQITPIIVGLVAAAVLFVTVALVEVTLHR